MTDWRKSAAALDPPIPSEDLEKIVPVLEALEKAFRPMQASLPASDSGAVKLWTGPEDIY